LVWRAIKAQGLTITIERLNCNAALCNSRHAFELDSDVNEDDSDSGTSEAKKYGVRSVVGLQAQQSPAINKVSSMLSF